MCGIWGWFDPDGRMDVGQRRMLAYLSHSRGTHGTGIVAMTDRGNYAWKDKTSVVDFLKTNNRHDPFRYNMVLAHNRRASGSLGKGSVVETQNTHPFTVGKITLAHNGYIENHKEIAEKLKAIEGYKHIAENYLVDSHILCAAVSALGHKEALSMVRGKASVWFINDDEPDIANIWCWNQDLALTKDDYGFTVFASENEWLDLCGFKKNFRLKDDSGQFIRIDKNDGLIESVVDIEGDKSVVVHNNWQGGRNQSLFDNQPQRLCYEYSIPQDVMSSKDLTDAFAMMNGHTCGICSKCNEHVHHIDCCLKKEKGIVVMYHKPTNPKSTQCGGVLIPISKPMAIEWLGEWVHYAKKDEIDIIDKWFKSISGVPRQVSFLQAQKYAEELKEGDWLIWPYMDETQARGMYDKSGSRVNSALRHISKSNLKYKWASYTDVDDSITGDEYAVRQYQ